MIKLINILNEIRITGRFSPEEIYKLYNSILELHSQLDEENGEELEEDINNSKMWINFQTLMFGSKDILKYFYLCNTSQLQQYYQELKQIKQKYSK